MKRSGPLRRFTPMTAKTGLSRSGMLKRGAFVPKRPTVTAAERKGRKALRKRSEGLCEICAYRPATDAHHRRNRSQQGSWAVSNLMHLCHPCHMHVTTHPRVAIEQGWTVRSTYDPATTPVWMGGRGFSFLSDDGDITEYIEEIEEAS